MRRWAALALAVAAVVWPAVGEATQQQWFESPAPAAAPGRIQHEGVSVDARVMDADEVEDVFDVNLIRKGVQPLLITIRNDSQVTYRFRKADVDAHYIPAADAAKAAYENPVAIGGAIAQRAVSVLHQFIYPPPKPVLDRPILNRSVQQSFVKEEIPDAEIAPNSSLSGFLYIRPQAASTPLRVTLLNLQTQQPLVFDIVRGPG